MPDPIAEPIPTPTPEPTPTPTPEPTPTPVPTSENAFLDSLPEDIRAEPTMSRFKNVGDLAKSYLETRNAIGEDKVTIPKDLSDDKAMDAIYSKLGMPLDGKYDINTIDTPKELGGQDIAGYEQVCRKFQLTKHQSQGVYDWHTNDVIDSMSRNSESTQIELRKEWGLKYEDKVSKANEQFISLFGEDAKQFKAIVGNNVNFIKGMSKVADIMSEDGIGSFGNKSFTKTPGEAKIEMESILADKFSPYWGEKDREGRPIPESLHNEQVRHVESLQQMVAAGNKEG